jgi:hypothetical protein
MCVSDYPVGYDRNLSIWDKKKWYQCADVLVKLIKINTFHCQNGCKFMLFVFGCLILFFICWIRFMSWFITFHVNIVVNAGSVKASRSNLYWFTFGRIKTCQVWKVLRNFLFYLIWMNSRILRPHHLWLCPIMH